MPHTKKAMPITINHDQEDSPKFDARRISNGKTQGIIAPWPTEEKASPARREIDCAAKWPSPLNNQTNSQTKMQSIKEEIPDRPVATTGGGIRGQFPPNFVVPRKNCFIHIIKQISRPSKMYFPSQTLKPGYGPEDAHPWIDELGDVIS